MSIESFFMSPPNLGCAKRREKFSPFVCHPHKLRLLAHWEAHWEGAWGWTTV